MKKLMYLLLCAGLCFGCSNTTNVDDVKQNDETEIVEETMNYVILTDEENENIQNLLLCMNYGDEDNAYIDNLFNYVFDSYYSFDGFNLAQVPELDQRMMVVDGSIGYNVCDYYLESIGHIDIDEDLEKSTVATLDEYGEYAYITISRDDEKEWSYINYTVRESQLGDDYYVVDYTVSDGENSYESSATIYTNEHSWFGYSIFKFNQDNNKDAFELYDNNIMTSNTTITSINSESDVQEYIEAYLDNQELSYEYLDITYEDLSLFGDTYYISFMSDDTYYDLSIMANTGMILDLDSDAKIDSDFVLVDRY